MPAAYVENLGACDKKILGDLAFDYPTIRDGRCCKFRVRFQFFP